MEAVSSAVSVLVSVVCRENKGHRMMCTIRFKTYRLTLTVGIFVAVAIGVSEFIVEAVTHAVSIGVSVIYSDAANTLGLKELLLNDFF